MWPQHPFSLLLPSLPLLLLPLLLLVSESAECVLRGVTVRPAAHSMRICVVHVVVQSHLPSRSVSIHQASRCVNFAHDVSQSADHTDRMEQAERTNPASKHTAEQPLSSASLFLAHDVPTRLCAQLRSENDARKHEKQ